MLIPILCKMVEVTASPAATPKPLINFGVLVSWPHTTPTNPNLAQDAPPPCVLPLDSGWSALFMVHSHWY
jgi:hypothetical protein